MPFQAVPDGLKVEFNAIQNGVPVVNVWHVKDPEPHDAGELGAMSLLFQEWWEDHLRVNLSNSYVLQNITVTDLEVADGLQDVLSLTTNNQGLVDTGQAAGNAAMCVSLRSGLSGRSRRGRTFFGGLPQVGLTNAQTFSTPFATAMAANMQALIDALAAVGNALCVLSRITGGVLRVTGLLTEIIDIIVDTKVDSQRRRTAN